MIIQLTKGGNRMTCLKLFCMLAVAVLLFLSLLTANAQEVKTLEQGRVIEAQLNGGESHHYQFSLSAGQYARIVIEQRGVDVIELLTDPAGHKLAEVDGPNGTQGPELIQVLAGTDGRHLLEVRSPNKNAAPGRYELRIDEIRI